MTLKVSPILDKVTRAIDLLIEAGELHCGLIPSVLDRRDGRMPRKLPPAIPGQRENDRSFPGSNLSHDQALLNAMNRLGPQLSRPDYPAAADRYLRRFASHCTGTPSGLFPWGEHSFWNLVEDRPGNSYVWGRSAEPITHDHLLQAPAWLWSSLWDIDPDCVRRFCVGLDGHWRAGDPPEYNRHALIDTPGPFPHRYERSFDFPRHSGFYVLDLATAAALGAGRKVLQRVPPLLDYWWAKRDGDDVLQIESRSPASHTPMYRVNAAGQTLSLGVSLLESAALLADAGAADTARAARERGSAYVRGFLAAPHATDEGRVVLAFHRDTRQPTSDDRAWGSRYGAQPLAAYALLCLRARELGGDLGPTVEAELLRVARVVALRCVREAIPSDVPCPAKDAGLSLSLLAELSVATGERSWLDDAVRLAAVVVEAYFDDAPLPRVATGADWYESQTLPGHLLYGLARVALLAEGSPPAAVPGDFSAR